MRRVISILAAALAAAALLAPVAGSQPGAPSTWLLTLERPAGTAMRVALARFGPAWAAEHFPAAAVSVRNDQVPALRHLDGVRSVRPDRQLPVSAAAPLPERPAPVPPSRGAAHVDVTGRGVGIAIVDTGIDGTHPDLAPALAANVKFRAPVIPLEGLPNTDTTSGHGTMVAGEAAGRGTASDGRYRGMAPGASLVGLAVGEGINVDLYEVIRAYDWMISHRDEHNIRVVNNSFGSNGFGELDLDDPINIATRAADDNGILVVFAAGNSGDEMTLNSHAAAPWVLSAAAGTPDMGVTDFSAGGIEADVSVDGLLDGQVQGDPRRPLDMGHYHPSVVAFGDEVVGPRAPATIVPYYGGVRSDLGLPPGDLARYTVKDGTSLAAPITAGAAALIFEAAPALRPSDVRAVLQVTARPVPGVPFYRQGYGFIDVPAAVALAHQLAAQPYDAATQQVQERQAARDAAILDGAARPLWTTAVGSYMPFPRSGIVHPVGAGAARLKVVVSGATGFEAAPGTIISVRDAAGKEVARTGPEANHISDNTILEIDLRGRAGLAWGDWRVHVGVPAVFGDTISPHRALTVIATFGSPPTSGARPSWAPVPPG